MDKGAGLAKIARRDGQHFHCATWFFPLDQTASATQILFGTNDNAVRT